MLAFVNESSHLCIKRDANINIYINIDINIVPILTTMKVEKHIKGPLVGQINVRQTLAGMGEGDEWRVRRNCANVDSLRTEAARVASVTGACFSVFAPVEENWIKIVRTK